MDAQKIYLTIALMALVTYLPRMIPMVVLGGRSLSGFWQRTLKFVPIVTLSALIVPSGFYATSSAAASTAGMAAAVVLALCKRSLIVVIIGSIAAAALVGMIV